jgi:hypothetical protein
MINFSEVGTHTLTMHIKLSYGNSTAMKKFLKNLYPCGILTRDLRFCRRTPCLLCLAARA